MCFQTTGFVSDCYYKSYPVPNLVNFHPNNMKEKKHIDPPKWPLKFLRFFVKKEYLEEIEGDMEEVFQDNLEQYSIKKSKGKYAWEMVKLIRPGLIKNLHGNYHLNQYGMFKNYFKVGVRNIIKYKAFSFINMFGLAVAMSVCMLIILMLADQKSYDQFHEKKHNVYRIIMQPGNHKRPYATGPIPLREALKTNYPIISEVTSLIKGFGGDAVYNGSYAEMRGFFTDPGFFSMFDFKLAQGDESTALNKPNSLILNRKIALQLFGDEDPLGKTIDFSDRGIDVFTDEGRAPVDWGTYTVTGVLADDNYKTHLKFDVLVSSASLEHLYKEGKIYNASTNWGDYSRCYTYVLVRDNVNKEELNDVLEHLSIASYRDSEKLKHSSFMAQPLTKITPGPVLGNELNSTLPLFAYYILAGLAFVIMIFACLNYVNLSIARAVTRFKEIGVRKVNGARRKDLIFQFLSESMITALLSLGLGIVLLFFVKSAFLNLWINQYLNFELSANINVYLIFLALAMIVGVIAGVFPAIQLSGYKPVKALKNLGSITIGRLGVRKTLTVSQFVVSLLFIVTSIVGFNQFKHFMEYEYSFNAQNVVNINLQSNDYRLVKNAFNEVSGISGVTGCAYYPATGRNDNTYIRKTVSDDPVEAIDLRVDENFINVMELELIAGKNLPPEGPNASSYVLVTERTAKALGYDYPGDIVGELLVERGKKEIQVIGVVEDFTFSLLFFKANYETCCIEE